MCCYKQPASHKHLRLQPKCANFQDNQTLALISALSDTFTAKYSISQCSKMCYTIY